MSVMTIGVSVNTHREKFPDRFNFPSLMFNPRLPPSGTLMTVPLDHRICSSPICVNVESAPGEFSKCGGCQSTQYCSAWVVVG